MVRWGEVAASPENAAIAATCFRPDLYRAALSPLGVPVPAEDFKTDGERARPGTIMTPEGPLELGADLFFDGEVFRPDALESYIDGQRPR
jgi:two-component system, oxyanion-binding sensor